MKRPGRYRGAVLDVKFGLSCMKKIILVVSLLSLLTFTTSDAAVRFANDGKVGLTVKSIDTVLRLPDNQVDIATATLLLSKQWNPDVSIIRYRAKIDNMAIAVRERMARKRIGIEPAAINVINDYLYKDLGFKAVPYADDPQDLFLDSVIDRRQGYCLSLSILYLSIAERLGLPIYGIVVPGHFFVRWDDGTNKFNIETTSGGSNAPDEHYVQKFNVTARDSRSLYLKRLNNAQIIGCFYNNLGNLYQDINEPEQARQSLERAIEINPQLALGHTNLGNVYLKAGDIAKAIAEYRTALDISDDDAKTHNNLGNAYNNLAKYDLAAREYETALKLDPNLNEAYRNLAHAYLQTQDYAKAAVAASEALRLNPQSDDLLSELGEVYIAMGNYDKAINHLGSALKLRPNSTWIYRSLAYAYLQKGLISEAISQYQKAVKYEPLNADLYYGMAQAYNKLGKFDDEIAAYKQALSLNPEFIGAIINLGNAYQQNKKYEQAIAEYQRAVKYDTNNAYLYYNMGVAYSRLEKHAEAVKQFQLALKADKKYGDAHVALAISYYMLEKPVLAREHADQARALGTAIPDDLAEALKTPAK